MGTGKTQAATVLSKHIGVGFDCDLPAHVIQAVECAFWSHELYGRVRGFGWPRPARGMRE